MSEENVEIVRAAWEALERGDLDTMVTKLAPDAELDLTRAVGMDRGVYTVDEFRRLNEQFVNAWESVRWVAEEFIDAGDQVVMPFANRLRGRDGIQVEARGVFVWTIHEGLTVRATLYQDKRE